MTRDMTFSNGIIKSLEKDLLTTSALSRLIDEADYKTALASLRDQGFGKGAADAENIDDILLAETVSADNFVREFSPSKEYSEFFLTGVDFYNAERYVRSKFVKGYAYEETRYGLVKDVAEAIEKNDKKLPDELKTAVKEAEELFESGKATGAAVSTIFAKALYARLLKKCGGELKTFIKNEIDAANISTAFRSKTEETAEKLFIDGGNLKKEDILFIFSSDNDKIDKKFAFTPYKEMISVALFERAEKTPFINFERSADGFALGELKKKKYETEGATPFMLYCLYKRAEIKNVRIIMTGKRAKAQADEIKRRLRVGYDG